MDDGKITKLVAKLEAVAERWQACVRDVGAVLIALRDAGDPVDLRRRAILWERFKMPMATSAIAMAWAGGDLGDDDRARLLVSKVKHSVLERMTPATVNEISTGKHRVVDATNNRVAHLTIEEMDHKTVSQNIMAGGFKPVGNDEKKRPQFRFCKARTFIDHKQGVVFATNGADPVHMLVPLALLRKAATECETEAACAV